MIDIHCHILPGIDDGPRTLNESLEMAKAAVAEGIDTIVATPHHRNNQFNNHYADIMKEVHNLNDALAAASIPLTILPGQETRIFGELVEGLEEREILPINQHTPYILIELPTATFPKFTKQLLYDVQRQGYKPVIVHPERNKAILEDPNLLYEIVKGGTLSQVTAASILGKFGKKIQELSFKLIDSNLCHFVASDAHNISTRSFVLREAYDLLESEYGSAFVNQMTENAADLIEGRNIVGEIPERIKTKKKLFGIFG
ncbi:protein-tyrosine phosphatase [Terribacillus halophilus]|uniref:Tyrosine-protein phosphatase n=1 Tax=Terribacillus halophilus TaxID=361279 RepID=A0A1G6IJU8_9BACI|nr:CpsB/CapC family capsule biosynthesis tyrosine phosphatase [Terribacillus halophilus]SDC06852.1 protein-tyrosine phosphatase [Terribacillus halophilus]